MKRILIFMLAALMLLTAAAQAEVLTQRIAVLRSLGIRVPEGFEARVRDDVKQIIGSMPQDFREDTDEEFFYDYAYLLSWLGMGEWDAGAEAFIPYGDDVYAFDAEMYDISGDYVKLLEAVARISGGTVAIENCGVMPMGERLWGVGLGRQKIDFTLNGIPRVFSAKMHSDWMDVSIIEYLNECLEEDGAPVRVWCMYDMGQGFVLFCQTPEWAAQFEAVTGCRLCLDPDDA